MSRDHAKPIRRYSDLSACEVNAREAIGRNAVWWDRLSAGVGAGVGAGLSAGVGAELSAVTGVSGGQASFSYAGFSVLTC
jgi:hypothetical protein